MHKTVWKNFRGNLLFNLSKSVLHFSDVDLICRDGVVRWSRFLLAANSPLLRKELSSNEVEHVIHLPSVSAATVSTMLRCTIDHGVRSDILSVNELQVMKLLGFVTDDVGGKSSSLSVDPSEILLDLSKRTVKFEEDENDEDDDDVDSTSFHHSSDEDVIDVEEKEEEHCKITDSVRRRASDTDIKCRFCDRRFSRSDNLLQHVRSKHLVKDNDNREYGRFTCLECGVDFSRHQHLEQHVSSAHQRDKSFSCEICGKVFYHEAYLKRHREYHKDKRVILKCDDCDESFGGKRALKSHRDTVHNLYQCHECGIYVSKARLKSHLIEHEGTKTSDVEVICHVCDKKFSSVRSLSLHKRSHDGGPECKMKKSSTSTEALNCTTCGKSFSNKFHLNSHIKNVHSQLPVRCNLCEKEVKSLSKHMKAIHSQNQVPKDAPVTTALTACLDCGKMFSSPYSAKYHHQKVHLKVKKKEKCKICGKEYEFLKRHLREVHSENRHECVVCGKFFPVRYSLERHIKNVHETQKLECPQCNLQVVHLSAHLTTVHKLPPKESRMTVKSIWQ